jgi:hypothetical protein
LCPFSFFAKHKQITERDLDEAQPQSSWWAGISFVYLFFFCRAQTNHQTRSGQGTAAVQLVGGDFVCVPFLFLQSTNKSPNAIWTRHSRSPVGGRGFRLCSFSFFAEHKQITERDLDKAQPQSSWWAGISFVFLFFFCRAQTNHRTRSGQGTAAVQLVGGDFVCAPSIPP